LELRELSATKTTKSIITLAMRGDGDMPMSEGANIELLEKIVADQRKIIAEHVNPDLAKVPQDWALYKEVQEYYEKGMRVPDDVTLLWCDDNWGTFGGYLLQRNASVAGVREFITTSIMWVGRAPTSG